MVVMGRLFPSELTQRLGASHRDRGDLCAGLESHAEAEPLFEALDNPVEASVNSAHDALCEVQLGRPDTALSMLVPLLERLSGELATVPAHETITLRWTCHQVLKAVGDSRAALMLEQLYVDVQACAAELTDAADRDRLIQALSVWHAIVAAHGRAGAAP